MGWPQSLQVSVDIKTGSDSPKTKQSISKGNSVLHCPNTDQSCATKDERKLQQFLSREIVYLICHQMRIVCFLWIERI
jgi:phosphatidate phosphatase APP1